MPSHRIAHNQAGFSLIELLIAVTIFSIIMAAAFTLLGRSLKVSTATYELTDAQGNLRFAQEYIARDLLVAGDAMQQRGGIRLPVGFINSFISRDLYNASGGFATIEILNADDQNAINLTTPASVAPAPLPNPNPAWTLRPNTDRIAILARDTALAAGGAIAPPPPVNASKQSSSAFNALVSAPASNYNVGEIYFLSSTDGTRSTFGAVTAKAVSGTQSLLTFANTDPYGLNQSGSDSPLNYVTNNTTNGAFSIERMRIITYFVRDSTVGGVTNGILIRRVLGVSGAGYTDSVIAEHISNLQFRYALNAVSASGNLVGSVDVFATDTQQKSVRQVEVTVTAETTHNINAKTNANTGVVTESRQTISSTTGTSIRNLQFNKAL
ncbi:MAG: prepilin-type N-terminal cleavage/methylation domain-containing protein [Pyrinomonadaceae bacterium MAG19_C2-C3]|nr:prepilin-type N-terminal cleavage/methylation domain-containing protein [Pyrinomonadaceae bacterium MAG19_C2-C3]